MPEIFEGIKDRLGNSLATEILSGDWPLDHEHVNHHGVQDQQKVVSESLDIFQEMFTPPHGQETHKTLRRIPPISSLSVSQPDNFRRHASGSLRLEIDACHDGDQFQHELKHQHNYYYLQQGDQQTVSSPLQGSGTLGEQSLQLEGPEIEDWYTSWMGDVLHDFPATTTDAELPPLVPASNAYFDQGPVCQITISAQQPQYTPLQSSLETSSRPARPTESKSTIPLTNIVRTWSHGAEILKAPGLPDRDVSYKFLRSNTAAFSPRRSASSRYQRGSEKSKKLPHMEKLDHVQRERQRRNDMSFKISILEGLLPPPSPNLKRDRAAIVHDSVQYVKSLQGRVQELRKTLAEMKLKISTSREARQAAVLKMGKPVLPTSSDGKSKIVEYCIQVEGGGEELLRLEKCRCRSDFMSSAMKILEHLNLDVCRCTVTKMFDYTICVIIAKSCSTASAQIATSASVASAFRSFLRLS